MLLLYRLFFPILVFLLRLSVFSNSRLYRHIKIRNLFNPNFIFNHPVWLHASSVGEYEQAREVILELKDSYPDQQVICSIFSASAWEQRKDDSAADYLFPLPFDHFSIMNNVLDKVKPSCILYARYDIWPNLISLAAKRKIPQMLFCASNPPGSKRFQPPLGHFQKIIHRKLQCIATIDEPENIFFQSWFHKDIVTLGDTRYDAIYRRLNYKNKEFENYIAGIIPKGKKVLVAGSCYKNSIKFLIEFLNYNRGYFLILVPHHPSEDLNKYALDLCRDRELQYAALSKNPVNVEDCLMVDEVGRLLDVYRHGNYAYVGGGWEGSVHTVIEPVALGLPTFCGPMISVSKEAIELNNLNLVQKMTFKSNESVSQCIETINKNYSEIQQSGKKFFGTRVGSAKKISKYLRNNGWLAESVRRIKIAPPS
jgi:3-deoxy-D-manno-octulosonic-acid transferase